MNQRDPDNVENGHTSKHLFGIQFMIFRIGGHVGGKSDQGDERRGDTERSVDGRVHFPRLLDALNLFISVLFDPIKKYLFPSIELDQLYAVDYLLKPAYPLILGLELTHLHLLIPLGAEDVDGNADQEDTQSGKATVIEKIETFVTPLQ